MGADSEVGCLRTVLMHRPGPEFKRITPKTMRLLEFGAVPWAARAQQEHDILAAVLRDRHIDVVYLSGLLRDVLEYSAARDEAIASVLVSCELGDELAGTVHSFLDSLSPGDLAAALIAGLTPTELRTGRGLVYALLDPHDFIVEPLPKLVYTKDASSWVGDQVVLGGLAGRRQRESDLLAVIYGHHPAFAGLPRPYRAGCARLDGGDVLLLGPGVVAIGASRRTSPASVESLARHLLGTGAAQSVLAVPLDQPELDGPLDTVCTVLDPGVVLMAPALAFTLTALTITITIRSGGLDVSRPMPFVEAAARALRIEALQVIPTGLDAGRDGWPGRAGQAGQWDDGGNALALGGRLIVSDERNGATNARLSDAGFDVVTVPCGELAGIRGGPRSMCAALRRDSLAVPEAKESSGKATPESDRTAAPSPAGAEQPAGVPALELAS
ncbi:MAG TPA: arginine deiminase family protein [Streptosporangiaceae bacterium]|jgi:arginine deiminase|nr:arginine deiminase family protein [Streptosporangiaceae bacterium]